VGSEEGRSKEIAREVRRISWRKSSPPAQAQSIARLQQATSVAVSTLSKVMVDANTPASTKV
jgi:uncharacterized protein YfaQ (DUF2300 family)